MPSFSKSHEIIEPVFLEKDRFYALFLDKEKKLSFFLLAIDQGD